MPVLVNQKHFLSNEVGASSFWSLNLTNLLFSLLTLPNPQVRTG